MSKNNRTITFRQGEIPREELQLPQLYFVATDNWIDVIGERAFVAWLKMYTWCDRENAKNDPHLWNEARIPTSYKKLIKRLGVGNDTFYKKILRPLWNVGLIDVEEYEESDNKGNKPMNVIVYKYPQNKFELSVKPLEKVRNYDTDYSSDARTFALRKSKKNENETLTQEQEEQIEALFEEKSEQKVEPSENQGVVPKQDQGVVPKQDQGVVPKQDQGWSQNRTRGGSEIGENNNLNNRRNNFNDITNNLNEKNNIDDDDDEKKFEINRIAFQEFKDYFSKEFDWEENIFRLIEHQMKEQNLSFFTVQEAIDQGKRMENFGLEKVSDYSAYFVGGIILNRKSKKGAINKRKLEQEKKRLEEQKAKKTESKSLADKGLTFYNWLEKNSNEDVPY